jgi:hypothetical protein
MWAIQSILQRHVAIRLKQAAYTGLFMQVFHHVSAQQISDFFGVWAGAMHVPNDDESKAAGSLLRPAAYSFSHFGVLMLYVRFWSLEMAGLVGLGMMATGCLGWVFILAEKRQLLARVGGRFWRELRSRRFRDPKGNSIAVAWHPDLEGRA